MKIGLLPFPSSSELQAAVVLPAGMPSLRDFKILNQNQHFRLIFLQLTAPGPETARVCITKVDKIQSWHSSASYLELDKGEEIYCSSRCPVNQKTTS